MTQDFSPQSLHRILLTAGVRPHHRLLIAYSGGLDSQVLLHSIAEFKADLHCELIAAHANHGLHPEAAKWMKFCSLQTNMSGIPLLKTELHIDQTAGQSLEAQARKARYAWFESIIEKGDFLLTAHHKDDQVETLLLALFRGGGIRGLSSMPRIRQIGKGVLLRPLLGFSRADLRVYAESNKIPWLEDPSNTDIGFDRNYLRHRVLPQIINRWPAATASLSRSVLHLQEAQDLLDEIADQDLNDCLLSETGSILPGNQAMSIPVLQALSSVRRRNLIRFWLHEQGCQMPSMKKMQEMEQRFIQPGSQSSGKIVWGEHAFRCYRNGLYLTEAVLKPMCNQSRSWNGKDPIDIPVLGIRFICQVQLKRFSSPTGLQARDLTIRFRQGGEKIRLNQREHRTKVKKLFQDRGIPPWERNFIPLIYLGNKLVSIPVIADCELFSRPSSVKLIARPG